MVEEVICLRWGRGKGGRMTFAGEHEKRQMLKERRVTGEEAYEGSRAPESHAETVRTMAVAISSCEAYGQQRLRMPLCAEAIQYYQ
jgi:hypothetical protein